MNSIAFLKITFEGKKMKKNQILALSVAFVVLISNISMISATTAQYNTIQYNTIPTF